VKDFPGRKKNLQIQEAPPWCSRELLVYLLSAEDLSFGLLRITSPTGLQGSKAKICVSRQPRVRACGLSR
jgi:hypothetical protein